MRGAVHFERATTGAGSGPGVGICGHLEFRAVSHPYGTVSGVQNNTRGLGDMPSNEFGQCKSSSSCKPAVLDIRRELQ
eukprot:CAMPEP_0114542066 /NCGR_PEP_ID=MMETSP0114-20121206/1642_1 /TAXON_ID=31324 /ORGANISM="Goniomonas sp, Strain m" /LENGTH=77 /DNA_ID=CAMNT_0001726349 /DNA_START=408 /DNA_END=638 /DNA_ORIENTATION=-